MANDQATAEAALQGALAALKKDERARGLEALLAAWRALRAPEIADAIAAGDVGEAERLMSEHDLDAARTLAAALAAGMDTGETEEARA